MGTPCGAQGSILLLTKVDGSKNVLLHTGWLARPLPIIRETTESPAAFLAWFRVPFTLALIGVPGHSGAIPSGFTRSSHRRVCGLD